MGNVLSFFRKLLFLSPSIDYHVISRRTEEKINEFIIHHKLQDIKVRLNQYAPHDEFLRLFQKNNMSILIRIPLGFLAFLYYFFYPGRVFGGDWYNPFSNSINIYSDHSAIALHELGHAVDFRNRKYPGLYQITRFIPFAAQRRFERT